MYLKNFQTSPLIVSFVILILIYPESALAWFVLAKRMNIKVSLKNALYLWIVSNTARFIPGAIWQYVGRVELGQQMGISRKEGILIVFYETLLIVISGSLFSLFAIKYWAQVGIKLYMIILIIIILLIIIHPAILNKIFTIIIKLTKKEKPTISLLKIKDLLLILPLFLINFILNGLALTFLIYAFTGNFEIEKLFLISGMYALSWLIGYLSVFAPGGIGVTEVSLALFLSLQFSLPLASAIAVVYRFLLVVAELIIFIFILKFKNSKIL